MFIKALMALILSLSTVKATVLEENQSGHSNYFPSPATN